MKESLIIFLIILIPGWILSFTACWITSKSENMNILPDPPLNSKNPLMIKDADE